MTAKIRAAVDALGLPIRFEITPGHWRECPQAIRLITVLTGVGQPKLQLWAAIE